MDSATQYDAGTEQNLTTDPASNMDLQPFDLDERILWAFRRGLASRGPSDRDLLQFTLTIGSLEGQAKYTLGYVLGFGTGAKQAVLDYNRFVGNTLHLFVKALKDSGMVFDPNLVIGSVFIYSTAPGTKERAEALATIARYFKEIYPAGSAALEDMKVLGIVVESVAEWLSTRDAIANIAVKLSGVLGDVLGMLMGQLRPYLNDAEKLGRGVGYIFGQFVMWAILDLLGFPYSVILDLLESMIESIETIVVH